MDPQQDIDLANLVIKHLPRKSRKNNGKLVGKLLNELAMCEAKVRLLNKQTFQALQVHHQVYEELIVELHNMEVHTILEQYVEELP